MWTDRRMDEWKEGRKDRQTDRSKLLFAFRNFAKGKKKKQKPRWQHLQAFLTDWNTKVKTFFQRRYLYYFKNKLFFMCLSTPHMTQFRTQPPPMSVRKNCLFLWLKFGTYKAMPVPTLTFKALVNNEKKQQRCGSNCYYLNNETDNKTWS